MAGVRLDRVWLSVAGNPDNVLSFTTTDRSDKRVTPGEVRTYANGRQRLIRRPGVVRSVGLTAVELSFTEALWLADHAGLVMLLRDKPGRRLFGTYLAVDVKDKRAQSVFDVSLEFTELSYSEAV